MLWGEEWIYLTLTSALELLRPDEAELTLVDELVKLLTVALRVPVVVVALAHGSNKVAIGFECRVAVLHGFGWDVTLEEDSRGGDNIELASQIGREIICSSAHPDVSAFLVRGRGVQDIDELCACIDSSAYQRFAQ